MSEPVSNAEIEDVLSSIRRLVSNDVEAFQQEVVEKAVNPEPAAKLILTPDFRVVEPQDAQTDSTEDDVAAEAPVGETADEAADDMPDEVAEFKHREHSSDAETDFEDASVAELETGSVDQVEHANANIQDAPDAADEPDMADQEDEVISVSGLEGTIAELEAAIGQQDGEWEPDGSGFEEDAEAEEVMSEPIQDWIDGTAKDLDAEVEAADATGDDAEADLFGNQESVIDEETLRDMVSDIVRQELQGALGERITRNVRKLVRREINRVLAAQEFD